jgi:hypothetical protein
MQAHRFLLRAGIGAGLALALGAQAQMARVAPGTPSAAKTVNTQQAAAFGLPRAAGLSSPNPNSLTAGSTAVNVGSSVTTAASPTTTTGGTAAGGINTGTTGGTTTGVGTTTGTTTVGSTTDTAAGSGATTGTGIVAGGAVGAGAFSATTVMGAGTNLPAPRQGASMGPGPYTGVEVAGSFLSADANGDRELSRAEATRLSIMPFAFEEMDANHDGVVTRSEYETSFGR